MSIEALLTISREPPLETQETRHYKFVASYQEGEIEVIVERKGKMVALGVGSNLSAALDHAARDVGMVQPETDPDISDSVPLAALTTSLYNGDTLEGRIKNGSYLLKLEPRRGVFSDQPRLGEGRTFTEAAVKLFPAPESMSVRDSPKVIFSSGIRPVPTPV